MTSPVPIQSGMFLFPSRLNRPAWTSYSPNWTAVTSNPTIGNGLLSGLWRYLDDRSIMVRIRLDVGSSTGIGSGQYRFSLPVPAVSGGPDPQLDAVALHGGALYRYTGWANTALTSASLVSMYRANINTAENLASWAHNSPVTLASGHSFSMSGIYFYA